MILRGCSTDNTNTAREQAALTIAQLKPHNKSPSTSNYHLTSPEPPLSDIPGNTNSFQNKEQNVNINFMTLAYLCLIAEYSVFQPSWTTK